MRVGIIGKGRLGRSLSLLLPTVGIEVCSLGREAPLADVDLWWLTVPDRAIAEVAQQLPLDIIVLHAAGSLGIDILPQQERGLLHPLMTFPGPEYALPQLQGVFASVAGTPRALKAAQSLATALGMQAVQLDSDRRQYHAAAVMASSHLASVFLEAATQLSAAGLDMAEARAALLPLALESLRRVAADGVSALTGPTLRGDKTTELSHLSVLNPEAAALYAGLRAHILRLKDPRNSHRD